MITMVKHEILKKYKMSLILLCVLGVMAAYSLVILFSKGAKEAAWGFGIYSLMGFMIIIALLVHNIRLFSFDLMTKQGYMLFLTPNNGYKILGSKLIAVILENFFFIALYIFIGFLYIFSFIGVHGDEIGVLGFLNNIQLQFDMKVFLMLLGSIVNMTLYWVNLLLQITLAIALYKTLLSHVRYGKLISLGFFILILIATSTLLDFENYGFSVQVSNLVHFYETVMSYMIKKGIYLLLLGMSLFGFTGYLIDKKVNL